MEIRISTAQILKILHVISWIIFIGVCIEAGGFIANALFTLLRTPIDAQRLWQEVDLSSLYDYDQGHFFVQTLLMSIVALLRALLFYLIIKILHDNKLNLTQPFSKEMGRFMFNISYLTLAIGLFSVWGANYAAWLMHQGVAMPDIQQMRLGGADVWLFMSVTVFIIAHMFKRGIEIQTENELTV